MAKRDDVVPEDFVEHLKKTVAGFKNESTKHQIMLARMLWESTSKTRQHSHYSGSFWFTYAELNSGFGRGAFGKVNDRLKLFEVSHWSEAKGFTKAYQMTGIAVVARDRYMTKRWHEQTRLLYDDGIELKTLMPAIASKDMDGITTTAWCRGIRLNRVPVDIKALEGLRSYLMKQKREWEAGRRPANLFAGPINLDVIESLLANTAQVIRLAKTKTAGEGYVMHRYVQASSGRLYAKGVNLQTTPRVVKEAALAGLWEFDFSNCHYAILHQMANQFGYQSEAIGDYLTNKQAIRGAIAKEAGISVEQAKVCLLAIMYGARRSRSPFTAIPETIGIEAANRLYKVDSFSSLHQDIQKARRKIIEGHPRNRTGWIKNQFGRSIGGRASDEEILAHLIQGVEATALKTVLDMHPDDIVLLQHDGFTATKELDTEAIEQAVFKATGYQMTLEVERIQMNPDAHFAKRRNPNQKHRIANKTKAFSHTSAS